MKIKTEPTQIFAELAKAHAFNNLIGLYDNVEKNERFYNGDQWAGVDAPDLDKPVINILARPIKFFVSSVVSDDIGISVKTFADSEDEKPILDMIEAQFEEIMEMTSYKKKTREIIRDSAVDGDGIIHFYFDNDVRTSISGAEEFEQTPGCIEAEIIANTRVHFGDTASVDVQKQPFILIEFRKFVEDVKETARQSGGDAEEIVADTEDENRNGNTDDEKVTVVRKYYKQKNARGVNTVFCTEVTAGGVVRKPFDTGYARYPIAYMPWEKVKEQYHGQSAITGLIPNQIFVNKLFAMAMQHVKMMAFPKTIYNRNAVQSWSNRIGEAIAVNGNPNDAIASNWQPAEMSAQVLQMIDVVIKYTRDTMGTSDAALGNVKPDNTSAIIATQKATSMPLELQKQDFYSFVEDSVRIWLDMMSTNYGVRMVKITHTEAPEMMKTSQDFTQMGAPITDNAQDMQSGLERQAVQAMQAPEEIDVTDVVPFDFAQISEMNLKLNVDVGAATYWSELMQVQTLDNLMQNGILTDATTYLENMPRGYIPNKASLISAIEKQQKKMEQAAVMNAGEMGGMPV